MRTARRTGASIAQRFDDDINLGRDCHRACHQLDHCGAYRGSRGRSICNAESEYNGQKGRNGAERQELCRTVAATETQVSNMDNDRGFFINGDWVKPGGCDQHIILNPATGARVGSTLLADRDIVDQAVTVAEGAFADVTAQMFAAKPAGHDDQVIV